MNKSITDMGISNKETGVAEREEGQIESGETPAPSTMPLRTPPQTTKDGMMGRRLGQQQVQEESLFAVLIIEDSDRQEQWLNFGALVYDLRTPDTRPKPRPPLIGTMTTDARTAVVLSRYGGVVLNEIGMRMDMMGPVIQLD